MNIETILCCFKACIYVHVWGKTDSAGTIGFPRQFSSHAAGHIEAEYVRRGWKQLIEQLIRSLSSVVNLRAVIGNRKWHRINPLRRGGVQGQFFVVAIDT